MRTGCWRVMSAMWAEFCATRRRRAESGASARRRRWRQGHVRSRAEIHLDVEAEARLGRLLLDDEEPAGRWHRQMPFA